MYAVTYELLRQVSFSHWLLFAGFRLSALLLVPVRYWPAMALGEMAPLAHTAVTCVDEFGLTWAIFSVLPPPIAFAMPIVRFCQKRWPVFSVRGQTHVGALLLVSFLVSAVWTLVDLGGFATTRLPPSYSAQYQILLARWFIGNFLGVLTVVPLLAFLREAWKITPVARRWQTACDSRLLIEGMPLLLPALGLLVWLATRASFEDGRQAARMAMFLPVVFLALRHGWYGAAVGGTAASLAVVLTMPARNDPGTLQAEVFVAFAITTMLMLGARISALHRRDEQERVQVREALALAQRNIDVGEERLRAAAELLEHVRENVRVGFEHVLGRMQNVPASDGRRYVRQAASAQEQLFRLSDSLYPTGWNDKGLLVSLRQGSVARALSEAGVSYWCDAEGDFDQLSQAMHLALYRLVCESVTQVWAEGAASRIQVRIRAGAFGEGRWAVIQVHAADEAHAQAMMLSQGDTRMSLGLGGTGLGWEAVNNRVAAYQGRLRRRGTDQQRRVSIIVHDRRPPRDAARGGEMLIESGCY
ncbi:MASE1 domain-containing protein [Dyella sp.]|uniref:MASE1 domain-containing protein n=1 Tax=Dyella sp. TaxID=1869338 RepID=UPI002ED3A45E